MCAASMVIRMRDGWCRNGHLTRTFSVAAWTSRWKWARCVCARISEICSLQKTSSFKTFFICVHSYNLEEKTTAVLLPCSQQSEYSDSAIPCFGQECGWKASPGILPPAGCAKPCFQLPHYLAKTFRSQDDGASVQYIPCKTLRSLKNSCILK